MKSADDIARRAAQKLALSIDPSLPALTERILSVEEESGRDDGKDRYDMGTAIALASLLVSIAGLAWTIYRDLHRDGKKPGRDIIERRLRVETGEPDGIPASTRDLMIEVVVTEVIEAP